MVCERDPSSPYDPATGGVGLVLDGDWLSADGTTLGADDGIGVAAMQAVAESDSPHGPLELLFTTAEEVGLEGAGALDAAVVSGRRLLNLDSEEDGVLTIGCAGATDTRIRVEAAQTPARASEAALGVRASGVAGGHSGMDIASGRANAIKVLAQSLREAHERVPFRLSSLDGGSSRNAIPREARAVLLAPRAQCGPARAALEAAGQAAMAAWAATDPGLQLTVSEEPLPLSAWSPGSTATFIDLLVAVPSGPLVMSPHIADLVETSTSLGVAVTSRGELDLQSLTRTANPAALAGVLASLSAVAHLAGGKLAVGHGYPAWQPRLTSPLLAASVAVWRDLFGDEPRVTTAHAGLEPALIGRDIPGMDMLSIGPRIESPHSPGERVSVSSVQRFWRFLVATLDELST
jgi:dipeptidase D